MTCEEARADGMRLREECDAILVGAGTVLADDPALTRRTGLNRSVVPHRRVVVDGRLRVTGDRNVFSPHAPGEAWLATAVPEGDPRLAPFRDAGVRPCRFRRRLPVGSTSPRSSPGSAGRRRAPSSSRGGETAFSFLESGLVDRVTAYYAPLLLGGREAPSALAGAGFPSLSSAPRLSHLEVEPLGDGFRVTGRVGRPSA